jgi:glycosyltransferase involved in cell wall biosynthesis
MEVSAVVPTRNRSRLLPITLRSVLGQADVRFEIVVVDDASTDDTRNVVAALGDPRVRLISNATPIGPSAARNRGAEEARGEWLAFVDDDDLWAPTKLTRQVGVATEDGYAWVYAGAVNVDDRLRIIHCAPAPDPAEVVAALPRSNPIAAGASNVLIHRDAFEAVGGFNQHLRACEDWDLWLRLARIESPGRVPNPLVAYRMHAGNAILDVAAYAEGLKAFERLHGTTIDWGLFHRWLAHSSARVGDRQQALREFGRAALTGQVREVGLDLVDLARAGVRRRLGWPPREPVRASGEAWMDEARRWLEDLRQWQIDARDER